MAHPAPSAETARRNVAEALRLATLSHKELLALAKERSITEIAAKPWHHATSQQLVSALVGRRRLLTAAEWQRCRIYGLPPAAEPGGLPLEPTVEDLRDWEAGIEANLVAYQEQLERCAALPDATEIEAAEPAPVAVDAPPSPSEPVAADPVEVAVDAPGLPGGGGAASHEELPASTSAEELLQFAALAEAAGLRIAPIYRGDKAPSHDFKPSAPHGGKRRADLVGMLRGGLSDIAALGLWCGPQTRLVMFDVDRNLSTLQGDPEAAPALVSPVRVTSPKRNAGKFLYRVPEGEDVAKLGCVSLSASGRGYEILWGDSAQGVVFGDYPKNEHSDGGEVYVLTGDLHEIPDAPEWVLAQMREAWAKGKGAPKPRKGGILGSAQDTSGDLSKLEFCLEVIPPGIERGGSGTGQECTWRNVGMVIHKVGSRHLRFDALGTWRAWSQRSEEPKHIETWASGADPCKEEWETFDAGGGKDIGSLIAWAVERQEADGVPVKQRGFAYWSAAKKAAPLTDGKRDACSEDGAVRLAYEELMGEIERIQNIPKAGLVQYEMAALALEQGVRDRAVLDRMYMAHLEDKVGATVMTARELLEMKIDNDYIVPDLLPSPAVVVIHAPGGVGKTQAAYCLSLAVVRSTGIIIRGQRVPTKGGSVLILNADQNNAQLQTQLATHGLSAEDEVIIVNNFSFSNRQLLIRLLKEHKPRFVVIDSLSACMAGSAYSENQREYALDLYWLARQNGSLFPATTFLVVHHSNKEGGHRGTSAIRDAVDEMWRMSRPTEQESALHGPGVRIFTYEKSRTGRDGSSFLMRQNQDLTFTIADPDTGLTGPRADEPGAATMKALEHLRNIYPETETTAQVADFLGLPHRVARAQLRSLFGKGLLDRLEAVETIPGALDERKKVQARWVACLEKTALLDRAPIPLEPADDASLIEAVNVVDLGSEND